MRRIWNDESGQGMVEYGLIISLVAIVIIAALTAMGGSLKSKFTEITSKLSPAS